MCALIVAEMSSKGNLTTTDYAQKCIKLAKNHENAVGVISQSRLDDTIPDLIHMTPGVKIGEKSDNLGQQYNTPEIAVYTKGADVIIVGIVFKCNFLRMNSIQPTRTLFYVP